ncbi:MAG: hypothetical protein DRG87_09655 [Deltaproteobacteria bacterium]|nr:MAG: hypothetical protein DRG87_09655 [Deltaproteobacteria bacterium]
MVALYVSIGTLVGIILGGVIGVIVRKKIVERKLDSAEDYSKKVMLEASKQAETIRKEAQLQAKDKLYQMKLEFEEETTSRRKDLQNQERRLFQKEEALDKKMEQLEQRESGIANKEANIANQEDELKKKGEEFDVLIEEERRKLERIAGISAADAKEMLISSMELEARHEASTLIKRIEGETSEISS